MVTSYLRGVFSYLDAFSYIKKNGLTRYYWYCGIIGLFILSGLYLLSSLISPQISSYLLSLIDYDSDWAVRVSSFIVKSAIIIFLFIIYKYFVLIATSPLMSKLSEDIESNLDGDLYLYHFHLKKLFLIFLGP